MKTPEKVTIHKNSRQTLLNVNMPPAHIESVRIVAPCCVLEK
jgi:hypothetical protein